MIAQKNGMHYIVHMVCLRSGIKRSINQAVYGWQQIDHSHPRWAAYLQVVKLGLIRCLIESVKLLAHCDRPLAHSQQADMSWVPITTEMLCTYRKLPSFFIHLCL